ncbi:hypothetical protein V500_01934 [Pseudogymnoascus sp. VKM F-4518 (FW-2643)]|nr:hypothetical protein V500_01934 [Pseudogymnoascus sp. VKM F-4518 (FW-2643)]
MSDSSLSELEGYDSYDTHNEPTLPTLPTPIRHDINHIPTPLRLQPPGRMLPPTTSILFTKLLYSRLILDSNPPTVKMTCLQPNCGYSPTPQLLSQTSTELQSHITNGGRISITTDAWTARNYTEYAAVTGHWINEKWQHRCVLLDVIHLQEPIHSSEYLAQELAAVTDSLEITGAIFTCTRDNASANTVMLSEFEKLASERQASIQQPWKFTVKEGDVRCIAHIINLAVQAALKSLKASPDTETEAYWCEQGLARIPQRMDSSSTEVSATLEKLRRHIYVFRNRRAWKDALQKQIKAAGQKPRQLSLDMPKLDTSIKDIALTVNNWAIIKALELLFLVFLKPSRRLQSDSYPTLNFTIPLYLKMINKVTSIQEDLGKSSTIGLACGAALQKLNVREYHLDTERIIRETALTEGALNITEQEPDSDEDLFASEGLAFQEPEWRRWMLEPRPGEHTDILKYWCAKQYQYPVIARSARDHLAIPATSAASERVFSNGSDIITKKRNRLSPPTIRYLLCLRNWGRIQEADSDGDDADDEADEEV